MRSWSIGLSAEPGAGSGDAIAVVALSSAVPDSKPSSNIARTARKVKMVARLDTVATTRAIDTN